MKEIDKGWFAAAIDGEGTIFLGKKKGTVSIYNTERSFVEYAKKVFGHGCVSVNTRVEGKKICYAWVLAGRENIKSLLSEIMPYLIIKKDKAINMLKWIDDIGVEPRHELKGHRGDSEGHRRNALMATQESNAKKGNWGDSRGHKKNALMATFESNSRKGNWGDSDDHRRSASFVKNHRGNEGNSKEHRRCALMATPESNAKKGNRGNSEQHKAAALARRVNNS